MARCAYCKGPCPPGRGGWVRRPRRFCCTRHSNRWHWTRWHAAHTAEYAARQAQRNRAMAPELARSRTQCPCARCGQAVGGQPLGRPRKHCPKCSRELHLQANKERKRLRRQQARMQGGGVG